MHVMSRTDDVINVAGHRLSTGGMEEVRLGAYLPLFFFRSMKLTLSPLSQNLA